MSTEVERGRGLEREGIQTNRVRWNLPAAVCTRRRSAYEG